jgi:nitronate monooxygenase
MMHLDPALFAEGPLPKLNRPRFLAIVSSNTLATTMLRRASGRVDGLVIETPTAGGHNAPPRGKLQLNDAGEPVYGERDHVNIEELRTLGVPFWMAGGYGNAEKLREALEQGAAGIQVGTAFAFSEESGMRADLKKKLMAQAKTGKGVVFTDPLASPTGFPFKVAQLEGTASAFPSIRSGSGFAIWATCASRMPPRATSATAARRNRWPTIWPRAAKLRIRWAESACAMR